MNKRPRDRHHRNQSQSATPPQPPQGLQLTGAPVPPGLTVPAPYLVTDDGVWALEAGPEGQVVRVPVLSQPVLPVGVITPEVGVPGIDRVVLLYRAADGQWRHQWVPRSALSTHTSIPRLADLGLPITSLNGKRAVRYFADVLDANLPPRGNGLRITRGIPSMGWHVLAGERIFVCGQVAIRACGAPLRVTHPHSTAPPEELVLDADERDTWVPQALQAVVSRGNLGQWARALQGLEKYPRVLLALYGAFVPPLLELLQYPNFLIEYAYDSSHGKTTALRVAASVWGLPDTLGRGGSPGFILSGDLTKNAIEGAMALYNGLPLLLDDLHRMDADAQVRTVYMVAQGTGKGRAAPWGMARTRTSRTVAMISTERSVLGHARLGGLSARVLTVRGIPLGRQGTEEKELAERLRRDLMAHHGVAGPAYVQHLMRLTAKPEGMQQIESWLGMFREILLRHLPPNLPPQAGRLTEYGAVMAVAARLAHTSLPLPWSEMDALHALAQVLRECIDELDEQDLATQALAYLQSRLSPAIDVESETVLDQSGRQVVGSAKAGEYVALLPHYFDELLERRGFDPEVVLRAFADRGWIHVVQNRTRRYLRPTWRYRGERRRMVVLRWSPLMDAEDPTDRNSAPEVDRPEPQRMDV